MQSNGKGLFLFHPYHSRSALLEPEKGSAATSITFVRMAKIAQSNSQGQSQTGVCYEKLASIRKGPPVFVGPHQIRLVSEIQIWPRE